MRREYLWIVFVVSVVITGQFTQAQDAASGQGEPKPAAEATAQGAEPASDVVDAPADAPANAEETAPESPIESEEDAAQAVSKAAEDAKKTTTEAAAALKSGDVGLAAKKSVELFKTYGLPALVALVLIIVAYFVASFLARIASRPVRSRVDETLGRFVGKLVYYSVMLCAILGILQYFGIGVSSFAAVIAAAGFAVGLAFQGTLSNFSAGIMLLVFRPFKVGDVINAAGITAKVFEIDLFNTVFDTPDNRRIIVPNSAIMGGTIENISHHAERRVDVNVGTEYSASLDKTREVLTTAAESLKDKMLEGEGRGYQIVLVDLGDSAVNWTVRFWTTAADFWAVKEQLTRAVKVNLDAAGIGIPFPQMDVHLQKSEG
jgi:small conductance mechanosensitive channel